MPGFARIDERAADSFPGMVWAAGPDRLCRWLNRQWLEFTGRSLSEGLDHGWAGEVHADDLSRWNETYRTAFAESRGFQLCYRLRRRDGVFRLILEQAGPCRDSGAAVAGYVGFCADINDLGIGAEEREQWVERERQALAEAQAAHRLKDDSLSVLSHGLRTPLNTVMMSAQLLAISHPDDSEVAGAVATIVDSVKAQTRLIDEVVDTSRLLSGRISLTYEATDLAELAESELAEVAPSAAEKEIILEPAALIRPAELKADPGRVRQILRHLLANAVKFTPAGGHVKLMLERSGHDFRITVSDTGEGIAPEVLPVVFEAGRPRDPGPGRPRRSLGLGLAVARRLAEMHGGSVEARSEGRGKGATFVVTLPIDGAGPI